MSRAFQARGGGRVGRKPPVRCCGDPPSLAYRRHMGPPPRPPCKPVSAREAHQTGKCSVHVPPLSLEMNSSVR